MCIGAENAKSDGQEDMGERLRSTSVSVRRAAARQLADNEPENLAKGVLVPLLLQTLQDQDDKVRAMGAAAADRVAYANPVNEEAKRLKKAFSLDLSDQAKLREVLLAATADKSAEVRKEAIAALVMIYSPAPDIEIKLVEQFRKESEASVRKVIVEAIVVQSGDPSPGVVDVLVRALQDDKTFVKQTAAQVIGHFRPPELWGKLIENFPGASLPVNGTFLSAIQRYGVDAKPLVPRLEQALSESKALQAEIEQTLRAVKGESPK